MPTPQRALLDTVALLEDLPENGLFRGQVGTVVENLAPDIYEIEFSDNEGRTYATLALRAECRVPSAEQIVVLRYSPVPAA